MTELIEVLHKAGHRPAKHGSKWICAKCPPGKSPALKVDGDVFYCHRCGRGGNLITLKREIGVEFTRTRRTPQQRKVWRCARVLASEVKRWRKSHRRWLCVQFRNACDRELGARDRAYKLLRQGLEVDAALIDEAFSAAGERDCFWQLLESFDRLTPDELVREFLAFLNGLEEPPTKALELTASTQQEAQSAL